MGCLCLTNFEFWSIDKKEDSVLSCYLFTLIGSVVIVTIVFTVIMFNLTYSGFFGWLTGLLLLLIFIWLQKYECCSKCIKPCIDNLLDSIENCYNHKISLNCAYFVLIFCVAILLFLIVSVCFGSYILCSEIVKDMKTINLLYRFHEIPCPLNKFANKSGSIDFTNHTYSFLNEEYSVANLSINYKGNDIQAFVCQSNLYDISYYGLNKSLSFQDTLKVGENDTLRIKFPTWVCNYQHVLDTSQANCKISLIGNQGQANEAILPPEDWNFYIITDGLKFPYLNGLLQFFESFFVLFWIVLVSVIVFIVLFICCMDCCRCGKRIHYWYLGPFCILFLIYDICVSFLRKCKRQSKEPLDV